MSSSKKPRIYIKPENRGKFTATKKRTGKTTEQLTHSKNPLTRKRAIFSQNARKWKHDIGGSLSSAGTAMGGPEAQILQQLGQLGGTGLQTLNQINRNSLEAGKTPEEIQKMYDSNYKLGAGVESADSVANIGSSWMAGDFSGVASGIGQAIGDYQDNRAELKNIDGLSNSQKFWAAATPQFISKETNAIINQSNAQDRYASLHQRGPIVMNALGGKLAHQGTVEQFNPDISLNTYNNGGTHDNNALGGIPAGIDRTNGDLHTVEEGETRVGDYVFSNRIKLNNPKDYNLGSRLKGKTFAEASKKLYKEIEERPNDPIAKNTWIKNIGKLVAANEDAIIGESNQFMCGGKIK